MSPPPPRLLLITASPLPEDLVARVAVALTGAPFDLLLRDQLASDALLSQHARSLLPLLHRFGGRLLIHDRLELALSVHADGLHLPESGLETALARQRLGPGRLLGRSCHEPTRACKHLLDGGDYVTLSPLFATDSHPGAMPLGVARFATMRTSIPGAVLALGGIRVDNVHLARQAGASGVALIRGIFQAEDPPQAAHALSQPFRDDPTAIFSR